MCQAQTKDFTSNSGCSHKTGWNVRQMANFKSDFCGLKRCSPGVVTFSWRDIEAKGRGSLWWLLRVISWMGPVISEHWSEGSEYLSFNHLKKTKQLLIFLKALSDITQTVQT